MQASLKQLNSTIIHMSKKLEEVSKETTELIKNTNQITLDVQRKSKALDSIFESVENVGSAVKQVTHSAKEVSSTISQSIQSHRILKTVQNQDKMAEIIRLANIGIDLWKKWQARKVNKQNKDTITHNGQVRNESSM